MYGWLLTFWSWYSPFEGSGESIKGWWWQLEPFLHKEVNANDVYDSNESNQNKHLCEYKKFPAVAGIHYYTGTPFADSKPCLNALTSLIKEYIHNNKRRISYCSAKGARFAGYRSSRKGGRWQMISFVNRHQQSTVNSVKKLQCVEKI